MEKEAQKFLEAEETAEKFVQTLKQLHTEAASYQTATKELDIVRQRLIGLIEATEKIAKDSHEIIKVLKEIGGPEILSRITKVENKVSEESANQSKSLKNLRILIIMTLTSSIIAIIVGIIALLR